MDLKIACKLVAVVGLALTIHGAPGSSPPPAPSPTAAGKPAANKPAVKAPAKPESNSQAKAPSEAPSAAKPVVKPESKPGTQRHTDSGSHQDGTSNTLSENQSAATRTDHDTDHDPEHGQSQADAPAASHTDAVQSMEPHAALKLLQEGNQRWVQGTPKHPNTDAPRREAQAKTGQTPFAIVLTCADSRLPVERVLDRGVGEVFVIRVAGNVVGPHEAGTIEYGVSHLDTRLLVVMGHSNCGAVAAACSDAKLEGNVGSLVENIKPAVDRARSSGATEGAALTNASTKENVWQSVFDLLRTSPELCKMVRAGQIKIVGAVCDVSSGEIEWMGEHPWQAALVQAFLGRETATATVPEGH